ncbi:hypothetical protein [Clostridium sp. BL-8]|uniref:hypothetical protein n=1 Tax=Clostridium sp. BL-8 TaxID=349938 RepID=UPI0009C7052F|nr:hypothetical protein [Clostridium sp. BL-8]OOM79500.1 hypothetical protein CLOBL_15270 [Clostridium sp. BL-8]
MKSRQAITVRVHYPETVEGMELLKKSQAEAMIDILEKQLGEKKVEELFEYMKKKIKKT